MTKQELMRRVTDTLQENNKTKPITIPRQTFHISDDEGNARDFIVRKTDKTAPYTYNDVSTIIETCLYVVQEALKHGEPIKVHGFGTLGLTYRKGRTAKIPGTDEDVDIDGRYIPKFTFGNDLRMCARVYELSSAEKHLYEDLYYFEEDDEEEEVTADGD